MPPQTIAYFHRGFLSIVDFSSEVTDEAKDEVLRLGLDPFDDFKNVTTNAECEVIKSILDHEEFLETVRSIQ